MDTKRNCVKLVITGNPGVGKHTIAELFIKQDSSYNIFDISKFAIEKGFGEQMDDGNEVDTTKIKNEIKKSDLEKSVIVVHLAPYVLD
jgi:adenylate kinase